MAGASRNQADWASTAERLAAAGYRVLTYNSPGTCDPDGSACSERRGGAQKTWTDMVTAVTYLRANGANTVVAGGASAGAMAALRAAEEDPSIDGVIWFAAALRASGYDFNEADVALIQAPMLLISATEDPLADSRAGDLLAEWATAPARVVLVESDRHGTDVIQAGGAAAETVLQEIEQFIASVSDGDRSGGRAPAAPVSRAVPAA